MRKVQAIVDDVQDAPAHQLLDAVGSLASGNACGRHDEPEFEFAADDRSNGEHCANGLRESLNARNDEVAYSFRKRRCRCRIERRTFTNRTDHLYDHEWIAATDFPYPRLRLR